VASHALPTLPCITCSPPRAFVSITARRCISHVGQTPLCASNEIAIRSGTYALNVCVSRTRMYASVHVFYVHVCECARSTHRRISISMACIRIIYSARASLTAPTVTGRSSGRFSARMTVYEPLFCANFSFSPFFSFSVSLRFCFSHPHYRESQLRTYSVARKHFH